MFAFLDRLAEKMLVQLPDAALKPVAAMVRQRFESHFDQDLTQGAGARKYMKF